VSQLRLLYHHDIVIVIKNSVNSKFVIKYLKQSTSAASEAANNKNDFAIKTNHSDRCAQGKSLGIEAPFTPAAAEAAIALSGGCDGDVAANAGQARSFDISSSGRMALLEMNWE